MNKNEIENFNISQKEMIHNLEVKLVGVIDKLDYNGQDFSIYCRVISDCWKLKASLNDWDCNIDKNLD